MGILDVKGLSAGYENGFVVHDVSLAVEPGEFVAILGRNGSGKSTLIKAVQNLLGNVHGQVLCGGEDVFRMGLAGSRPRSPTSPSWPSPFSNTRSRRSFSWADLARQGRFEKSSAGDEAAVAEAMRLTDVAGMREKGSPS